MVTYASDVTVDRPLASVWPYLVEREKQAEWSDVPMQPLTEGPLRAGSQFRLSFGKGPLRASLELEMTAVDVNERMAWKTISRGGLNWEGEYRLAAVNPGATRLSQRGTIRFNGLWRLLAPLVGAEIKASEIKELEKLKAAAERAPASG